MSAGITVDLGSATPPYEQIRSQISSLVAMGELAAGSRLPTVRSLAADLGIAAGTVARAYRELDAAGIVESRRRGGTVVTGRAQLLPTHGAADPALAPATPAGGRVPAEVLAAVDRYIELGRSAGLADEVLLDLLRGRLRMA
ncbi:GntR family transcriptional regulator [Arthrobacter sp. ZBG10]|uniref:GntR family transcriptional regulator n=1 Tax=Arthrobacter sp. ZBG10 TaxID=1676590 RepID=UPI000680EA9D|nr:GntR family transcriptional regulator [Arthrobacter sp. ZBG10]KNH17640.1 GntR family transcriptional regulator [Arthrobacter sp. ZBG10]